MKYSSRMGAMLTVVGTLLTTALLAQTSANTRPCASVDGTEICLGAIDSRGKLSSNEREMLVSAGALAIETVGSEEFRFELDRTRALLMAKPRSDKKWRSAQETFESQSNDEIIELLLARLNGLEVDSFGYSRGTFLFWFYGTKAIEGKHDGPIELNRAALRNASSYSLANTIVHEAAHRIGLSHPNTDECEAPYLIGDLVQTQIDSDYELPCDVSETG